MTWKFIKKNQSCLLLIFIVIFYSFFFPLTSGLTQSDFHKVTAFANGERLKYKVKWGIIRLGTLEIYQKKIQDLPVTIYQIEMNAQSENLPFINVFFINEGFLNPYQPTLRHFTLITGREKEHVSTYIYDPDQNMIFLETQDHHQIVRKDSILYQNGIYDALGIFMMIRCLSNSGFNVSLKNIVDFKMCQTRLNFTGESERIKVEALPKPMTTLKFEGKAEWVGQSWAGVSGPFHGWISADDAAVPLKVKIQIFLGSITIELEDYTKTSWPVNSILHSLTKKN